MDKPGTDKRDKQGAKEMARPKEKTPANQRQIERQQQERGSGEGISGIQTGKGHPHGR